MNHERGQDELRNATGIDIERDINYVVAYMTADTAAGGQKRGAVVANGHFDVDRIQAFIREKGGIETEYRGKKLFKAPHRFSEPDTAADMPRDVRRHQAPDMAVAFLSSSLVAFGTEPALKQTIDLEHGAANVTANADLMKMIQGVDRGNAWAVGRFDLLTANTRLPEQVASQIPPITWFSASGHVNGGVSATFNVEAKDTAAAQNLRDVVNGFMALARLQAGSNSNKPEMAAMLQSIQVSGVEKTVTVSFTVPSQALEMFKQHAAPRKDH